MMQIPKSLLPSTAEVRIPVTGESGYPEFGEPVIIQNVRFEPRASIKASSYALQDATKGVLFIDAVNSTPAMELPAGSLVRVDGAASEVAMSVCRRFDGVGGRVHHWEVEL